MTISVIYKKGDYILKYLQVLHQKLQIQKLAIIKLSVSYNTVSLTYN